jgi:hypothetical protein
VSYLELVSVTIPESFAERELGIYLDSIDAGESIRSITARSVAFVGDENAGCAPAFGGSAGMHDLLPITIAIALSAISVALLGVALFWL